MKTLRITVMRKACYQDLIENTRTRWSMPATWKKTAFFWCTT